MDTLMADVTTRAGLLALTALLIPLLLGALKDEAHYLLGVVPSRLVPVVALLLGVGASFGAAAAFPSPAQHPFVTGVIGLAIGLTAVGAHASTRALAAK